MVESFVVDASVVAKWFNRGEEFEGQSDQIRRAWVNDEIDLVAPSHLPFEVANSIWKNPNIGVRRASNLAKVLVEVSPRLQDLSGQMAERTMAIARRKNITFYDAAYIALARFLSIPLITADSDQLRLASGYAKATHLSTFASTR
jgi:predicted nucleic acid-binding protein